MPRTKISEFSATPANNTDIDSINIAEGCAPSGINDAIRELMAQLKDFQTGAVGDSFNGPIGTTTAAAGAFTTLSASSTVSGTGFSTYLASPPAIGGTAAAAGTFTTLTGADIVSTNSLDTRRTHPTTTAQLSIANFNAISTGDMVDGFGPQQRFFIKDTAGVDNLIASTSAIRAGGDTTGAYVINVGTSGSVEGLRVTSTGVGIGTSSPSEKLTVSGNISYTGTLTGAGLATFGSAVIGLSAANTDFRVVRTLGNPTFYAGVKQSGQGAYFLGNKSDTLVIDSDPTNETSGSNIAFNVDGSEKARFDSSGQLLIGSTTNTTSANLILTGATRWAVGTQGGGNIFYIVRDSDGVGQYMVQGTTSWTSTSDERVKDIIEPITDAANKVSTLRAVIGKFKKDAEGTRRSFLIAQDVQAVLPEAVTVQEDEFGTLGIQYTEVIPLLVAAIKEQTTLIESLKARLDAANL